MLDGRLSAAMALGAGTRVFADIGADHGRLSAALLLGGAGHGLVSDVSAAALERPGGGFAPWGWRTAPPSRWPTAWTP